MFVKLYVFLTFPRMVFCVFLIGLTVFLPLSDPDYFWHIKTGEYIFTNHLLPRQDVFSYTMVGHTWVLHEWLFQVLIYLVYAVSGNIGIKLFSVILILTSLFLIYSISKKLSSVRVTAAIMLLLIPLLITAFISPRPQLFTYVFFSYYLYGLLSFKYFNNVRYLYGFPLIMIFWVNLHGGYIVGIALLFLFALTESLSSFLEPGNDKEKRNTLFLFGIALLSLAASSLNPDFIEHWKYPFQVMSMDASKSYITEWKSPDFHGLFGKLYLLSVFIFFIANIYRKNRPGLTELIFPLFFITQGFVSSRHTILAILSVIPFIAVAINNRIQLNIFSPLKNDFLKSIFNKFKTSPDKDLGNKEYLLNWLFLGFAIIIILLLSSSVHEKIDEKTNSYVPLKATEFIVENHIHGRMFNTYVYGGYLIYRLYPDQKIFIDGRADMYGDDFIKKYIEINNGLPNWEKEFNQYDIDYVICKRNAPIRQLLLAQGDFKLVYDDEHTSVLVKNIPRFDQLIEKYAQ